MPGWKEWLPWSAAGGLLAAVMALSEVGFALEEGYGLETLFRLRGAFAPPSEIVVLRLDNDSLSVLRALPDDVDAWPAPLRGCAERHPGLVGEVLQVAGIDRLPRRLQACVVELAHAAGARTIVYDIAFPASPDREAGTPEFAAAIAAHGRVVLREATRREHLPGRTQLDIVTSLHPRLAAVAAGIATARLPDATGRIDQFWVRDRASPSPVQLAGRALEVSLLNTLDALARRLGRSAPDLGPDARREWLVATALAVDAASERLTAAEQAALAALRRVHEGEAHLYFNFYGPPGTVPSLPLWQLLDGSSMVRLAGATLFVGKANLTTSREPDTFETVMTTADGVRMSGVELWATAFANLRDGTALRALPEWRRIGVLATLGALLMLLAMSGGVTRSIVLTVAAATAWLAVAIAAFMLWTLWLPFVGLVVLLPATLLSAELRRFARARRSAARFMPAAVAHRVFDEIDIPTTWLDATVLLTDVVDFAARARRLEAQGRGALRAFQDRHIAMLAAAVRAEGGEVLEQTGDGVLALWTGHDHAAAACRAALAIAARIERQNAVPQDDEPPLRIRIGINSGPVTVGLIGGPERGFLTCSGDTVNMTQRLEALGKKLCPDEPAVAILLGQHTAAALGPAFAVELVAREVLPGHLQPDPVYRLHPTQVARARRPAAAAAVLLALLLSAAGAEAAPDCSEPIARLVARAGSVSIDGVTVDPGSGGIPLCGDSVVVVGADSRATLLHLAGDTMLQLDANSRVRLGGPPEPESGLVELTRGALFFISQVRRILTVRTPSADAGIEGTEVLVAVGEGDAPALDLRVYDGRVALRPGAAPPVEPLPAEPLLAGDRLLVTADGGVAVARGDGASLRLAAARELAWTLYYPPLFPDLAAAPPQLAEASRLLAAGRIEEAQAVLATVADDSPAAPDRDSLLAVIAVSQGDPAAALPIADAAVARRRSAATLLARSYALQALRRLEEARGSAREATEVEPGNALAWARLAELELAFGDSRAARRAADRSVATGAVPLVHVVQGFARLAAFDARGAEASFATALDADSNQPLAHLGRGLALIRRNDLVEGRLGLEAAAALDPVRSLLRSYLGKAYFEEHRDGAAAAQLRIAKELDPDDPTPWLYSAIQKQLANRPVEALRDLERSIELNDNRATFRSGLLLDEDRVVRQLAVGRIYNDLKLDRPGRLVASEALAVDPGGAGAHRLLSDLYQGDPQLEVARVSEVLQAQLLQDPGLNPVRPSLAFADLDLPHLGSFSTPGLNEYSALFERERLLVTGSGAVGNQGTWGNEVTLTGLVGRAAASLGQYHFETDGFRDNADLNHDIVSAFAQAAVTESLTLQAELRHRDSKLGDRRLDFDPDAFSRNERRHIEEGLARVGGRLRTSVASDLIFSFSVVSRDERVEDAEILPGPPPNFQDTLVRAQLADDSDAGAAEIGWLWRGETLSGIFGGGVYHVDNTEVVRSSFAPCDAEPCVSSQRRKSDGDGGNIFAQTTVRAGQAVDLSVGMGAAWFSGDELSRHTLTPRLGVSWRPGGWLTIRAGAARALRRPVAVNQTIEPTQLVGFPQLFDDVNATVSDLYSLAADARVGRHALLGLEAAYRDSSPPALGNIADDTDAWIRGYANWFVNERLILSVEPEVHSYKRAKRDATLTPRSINTVTVPLTAQFYHPSGWFLQAGMALISQDVARLGDFGSLEGTGEAVVVDLAAGYRLGSRLGSIRIDLLNLFDERVEYQDDAFRTAEQVRAVRFAPDRTILLRASLAW